MMLQKLLMFLKETDCKILIKYDGERNSNKYTIKLLYNDLKRGSLGKDTDVPRDVIKDIFENQDLFSAPNALELFLMISDSLIKVIESEFGMKSIISIMLEEKNSSVVYNLHLQTKDVTKHASALSIEELIGIIFEQ